MATSGNVITLPWRTYQISSSITSYSAIQLSWSARQNIASNTNIISWTLTFLNRKNSSSGASLPSGYERTLTDWSVTINGSTTSSSGSVIVHNGSVLRTGTNTIQANDDGTCTLNLSVSGHIGGGGSQNAVSVSDSIALDQIPRASDIECSSPVYMGTAQTVTITQKSADFSHILKYITYGGIAVEIGRNDEDTSYSWTPPDITQYITDSDHYSYLLMCETYLNSNYEGNPITSTLSVDSYVPASVVPTATISSIANCKADGTAFTTGFPYLIGYSYPKATFTFATADQYSTIAYRGVEMEGVSNITDEGTSPVDILTTIPVQTSPFNLTAFVIDSRGRRGEDSQTNISAYAYTRPELAIELSRADLDGTPNPIGDYLSVSAKWKVDGINNLNFLDISFTVDDDEYTYPTSVVYDSGGFVQISVDGNIPVSATQGYTVSASLTDGVTKVSVTSYIGRSTIPMSLYDDGTDIGVTLGRTGTRPGFNNWLPIGLVQDTPMDLYDSQGNSLVSMTVNDLFHETTSSNTTSTHTDNNAKSRQWTVHGSGLLWAGCSILTDTTSDTGTCYANIQKNGQTIQTCGWRLVSAWAGAQRTGVSAFMEVQDGDIITEQVSSNKNGTKTCYWNILCIYCTVTQN